MAQFGFNANGDIEFYSEYTAKGVNTLVDIFPNKKKIFGLLKLKNKQRFRDIYNAKNKAAIVRRIFYDFLALVFEELSRGGMLVFPGKTNANIALKTMPDDTVKKLSKEGTLRGVDITKTGYKVPIFMFDFGPSYARKDRTIKIPDRMMHKVYENAENGTIKYTMFRKMLQ